MRKIICLFSAVLIIGMMSCSKEDEFDVNLLVGQWECRYVAHKSIKSNSGEILKDTVYQQFWNFKLYENMTGMNIGDDKPWDYSLNGNKIKLGGFEGKLEELTPTAMSIVRTREYFNYDYETQINEINTFVFAKIN